MDTKALLDQLLESGKKIAQQGIDQSGDLVEKGKELAAEGWKYAEDQLPPAGPQRDAFLKKLGVGAAAGGVLALLLGTKSGRKTLAPIVKIGSVAALGGLAYKMYSEWQKSHGSIPKGVALSELDGQEAADRSLQILRAMVAAAKADGQIDAEENRLITAQIESSDLNESASSFLMSELPKPVNVDEVAAGATTPEAGAETYLASLLVTGQQSPAERDYLDRLAAALRLDSDFVVQLERETLPAL